jgi:hypothetical protein
MPRPRAQIIGKRYGRLVVVGYVRGAGGLSLARCKCDCGQVCCVRPTNLRSGNSQSCRCLFREIAHLPPADRALWPVAISVSWKPERMEVQHAA